MDYILATDWINNAYPEIDAKNIDGNNMDKVNVFLQTKHDNLLKKEEDPSWLEMIDEEEKENWDPEVQKKGNFSMKNIHFNLGRSRS